MTTYAPTPENLLLNRGAGYFAEYTGATLGGEENLGTLDQLAIQVAQETKEKYENLTSQSALYDSVVIRTNYTLNITGGEFSLGNIRRLLAGGDGTLTQTSGTVNDETVTTNAQLGLWYPLKKRKVSNVVVTVGTEVKAEGTDYTVDATSGRIFIVPTGTIAKGDAVVVDYAYATLNLETIEAGKQPQKYAMFRFISEPVRGHRYEVIIPKVQVTADGEFGLITDDYGTWTLTARILTVPGQAPFTVIKLD